jgi:hypothetical protein
MAIDPSLSLKVQPSRFGEIIGGGITALKQRERQEALDERQNRLLELQEQKAAADIREKQDKSNLKHFATWGLGLDRKGDVLGQIDKEIERVVPGSEESEALVEMREAYQQDPDKALKVLDVAIGTAREQKLLPKDTGKQLNILIPGKEGPQPGAVNARGQIIDPVSRKVIPGAIKAPTEQRTGVLTSAQRGKEIADLRDKEVKLRQTVNAVEELKTLYKNPDFVGGVAGDLVSAVNSAKAQFQQITGDNVIEDGKVNKGTFGKDLSKENIGFITNAARSKDRVDSAVITLAYSLAKLRDPGGRLSDADVNLAKQTIGKGADVGSIIQLLEDTQTRAIRDFNIRRSVIEKGSKELTREGILGIKFKPKEGTPQRLLRESGLGQ